PGMRVIDACAGAGGKSLHLSALMENKGKIISLDIKSNKLNELRKRAKRANSYNIETKLINNSKVVKKLHNSADIVLIDAPCSGIGVLRRNPDAKWKLSLDFYERIIIIQKEILIKYSKMVKSGGLLVYATCSIFPDENENQIRNFLISDYGKKFKFIKEKVIMPSISNFDGFYMCKLKRT
ncbi:MAG: RsmB/NOP family class I SAM-dependent RNA methyltransferase, partial [Bacteroidota bacterium]|nr:RsmB/NOP family class I SAM-dependent RNA methyltransferase [Bacteroidota bacterium]